MRSINALFCCLLISLASPLARAEDDPSLGDGYEHSSNPLISTAEATSTTTGDITVDASAEATTEATSGRDSEQHPTSATRKFAALYHRELARDFARGAGERASTLATLLHVPQEKTALFLVSAQSRFEAIYPSEDVATEVVLQRLLELKNHP